MEHPRLEPIALVGIGCRLPGDIAGPESFWRALCEELDVVGEVDPARWDVEALYHPDRNHAGTTYTRAAAMLPDVDRFDAAFFRIAPQEASRMDPQHRLLLEVAWEALEDAGQPPSGLAGRSVGVFMGQCFQEYSALQQQDPKSMNAYTMMGGAACMAANRLSYFLDLRGPSATVDTACASSLTAIHAACQSIWTGESALALAGGVNVSLSPGGFVGFSRAQMLSPKGRCHAFSAEADGYARAEGAGVVVLKPLSLALASGDRIYALVRATGINHHGRSQGISLPGVDGQAALLARTIERAGVDARTIQYVEAHGTGTPAGDPVEAAAIGRTLGAGRPAETPLFVGSVKSNVGHAEAAAGVVGVIKLALAIHHGHLPATLHAERTNPTIPFDELGLKVVSASRPWPPADGPRRGVASAFGFGGANACAVLEEAPAAPPLEIPRATGKHLLPLSARSSEALRSHVLSWAGMLRQHPERAPADLAYTASLRRDHHDHRLAVAFDDAAQLATLLGGWLRGEESPAVRAGRARGRMPRVAFAFCGNGPQWWGMARGLLATEPVFRDALERCHRAFAAENGFDLLGELARDAEATRMARTDVAQPALFAVQLGLCELLASWGVRPGAVVGHSVGEIAAAFVSGALDFADAVRVIIHRSRVQQLTEGAGRLAAAGVSLEEGERLAAASGGRVCVSAHNSARQITFSGELAALRAVGEEVVARGAFWRELPLDYAFHSRAMDPVREELLRAIAGIRPRTPTLPFYSTVSGAHEPDAHLDEEYWWRNIREPVRFAPATQALVRDGHDVVIEIGPHPVLRAYLAESAAVEGATLVVVPTLHRQEDDGERIAQALGALYAAGCTLDFAKLAGTARLVPVPTYAWQRERHWHEPSTDARALGGRIVHPLLGRRAAATRPEWRVELDPRVQTWLPDHVVGGAVVFPCAGYLEQCLAAARESLGDGAMTIEQFEIGPALVLGEGGAGATVTFEPTTGVVEIRGGDAGEALHARGEVRRQPGAPSTPRIEVGAIEERCGEAWAHEKVYERWAQRGLHYGPAFRGIESLRRRDGEALARIAVRPGLVAAGDDGERYRFHPALLDACIQTFIAALPAGNATYLPIAVGRFELHGAVPARLVCHATLSTTAAGTGIGDLTVADASGRVVARFSQFVMRGVDFAGRSLDELVHAMTWQPQPLGEPRSIVEAGSAATLAAHARSAAPLAAEALRRYCERTLPAENALCTAYVQAALARLGFRPRAGEVVTTAGLAAALGVVDRHARQLGRMLEFLVEDGLLTRLPDGSWRVERALGDCDVTTRFRESWQANPAAHALLELAHRVGLRLPELLRAELDPLELLFSDGSSATMEEIYDASPGLAAGNAIVRGVLEQLVSALPRGRRLDVLEVGAGTGGLTSWLLPALPPDRARYRFTDVTDGFAPAARARFAEYPFVEYERLDIEAPDDRHAPADLVVASNVLHATRDVRETLANLRRLVRPGGAVVFIEVAPGVRAVELVYGFLSGWWRAQDDALRPRGPLLPAATWRELMLECGFADAALATDAAQSRATAIVVARTAKATSPAEDAPSGSVDGAWLLLADEGGRVESLGRELEQRGARVVLARAASRFGQEASGAFLVRPDVAEDVRQVCAAIAAEGRPLRGIVHGWAMNAGGGDGALARIEEGGCLGLANVLRALADRPTDAPARLWIATRGARQIAADERPDALQAMMWGLGRSLMHEHPRLRCTLVDLDPDASAAESGDALYRELVAPEASPLAQEIAWRGDERLVGRLERVEPGTRDPLQPADATGGLRLERERPGSLAGLQLVEAPRPAPGPGEVEIAVHAAGLNFRDVLYALDVLPSRESPPHLGIECAGVVTAIGAGVSGIVEGDEVMAFANGSIGRYVVARAAAVVRKPSQLDFAEAATLPATFATALYALCHLGRLRRGDRLLVHGGAGALGLATLQIARCTGAEVYATAGTPEKRELLRELGAARVMDSRSLAFADEIREATGGEGVDVVLNSLAGEAMVRSLSVLKPLGRFLEVGKRDFFDNSRHGFRLLQQRSFHGVDLEKVMALDDRLTQELLEEVRRRCEAGEIRPLPHRVFPLARAADAFSTMQRSRHVGKLVIATREPRVRIRPAPRALAIRADGSYLVTGGLGGFGLTVAAWLAEQGAGRIVLLGRRAPDEAQAAQVAGIAASGTQVHVRRADASDEAALDRVLDEIRASGPPLRGVIHAAMVLDDVLLEHLTAERLRKVTGPKVLAALHLDARTRRDPLDLFVCCSSVAGLLGNLGQSVYAGANTALDALCERRHAEGLPALSVSLGVLRDAGFVARTAGLTDALAGQGMLACTAREAALALARALRSHRPHVGLFRYDWSRYEGPPGLVARLREHARAGAADAVRPDAHGRARILDVSEAERRTILRDRLSWHISRIVGVASDAVDPDRSIVDLGMDSLMMVDLQSFIQREFGAQVPVMSILQGWSLGRLVEEVERRLSGAQRAEQEPRAR